MSEAPAGGPQFLVDFVVMQPTTRCNLNCSYCYLPDRYQRNVMDARVAQAVAMSLQNGAGTTTILWHGGEPLATGLSAFRTLLGAFESLRKEGLVKHSLQTNATLITDRWITLLREFDISIGVSLDGPDGANDARRTWSNRASFESAMRGVARLKEARYPFHVISVIGEHNLAHACLLYDFVADLGCQSWGINIEESEGLNRHGGVQGEAVTEFWRDLFNAWIRRPVVPIREFRQSLGWIEKTLAGVSPGSELVRQLYPTVGWQGDVVLLSPEFVAADESERSQFVVGNVLRTPFAELCCPNVVMKVPYVAAFLDGVTRCKTSCEYFAFCRGGTASNKFYETGSVDATTTRFCVNNKQRLIDSVLSVAERN